MPPFQPAWKDEAAWLAARATVSAGREAAMAAYLADPRDTATVPAALDFCPALRGPPLAGLNPAPGAPDDRRVTGANACAPASRRAILAQKTGSARTDLGLTPATNEIGLVTLADGRRLAIAAFLAGSTATDAERDNLIADAARLAVSCVGCRVFPRLRFRRSHFRRAPSLIPSSGARRAVWRYLKFHPSVPFFDPAPRERPLSDLHGATHRPRRQRRFLRMVAGSAQDAGL